MFLNDKICNIKNQMHYFLVSTPACILQRFRLKFSFRIFLSRRAILSYKIRKPIRLELNSMLVFFYQKDTPHSSFCTKTTFSFQFLFPVSFFLMLCCPSNRYTTLLLSSFMRCLSTVL